MTLLLIGFRDGSYSLVHNLKKEADFMEIRGIESQRILEIALNNELRAPNPK